MSTVLVYMLKVFAVVDVYMIVIARVCAYRVICASVLLCIWVYCVLCGCVYDYMLCHALSVSRCIVCVVLLFVFLLL